MADEPHKNTRVLLLENDQTLSGLYKYHLSKEGYGVFSPADSAAAAEVVRREKPDIMLLDLMLSEPDNVEVCRSLRKESSAPILILTARKEEAGHAGRLEPGAYEYMQKPFGVRELMTRVRAVLRLRQMANQKAVTFLNDVASIKANFIEIDETGHTALLKGKALSLTPKEFDLLAFLVKNGSQVFKREQLLDKVWSYESAGNTRTVDVHISCLRKKIEDNPQQPQHIISLRGVGYKFEP